MGGFEDHGSGLNQQLLNDVHTTFTPGPGQALPEGTAVRDYATKYALPLTGLLHGDHRHPDSRTRKFVGQSNAAILVDGIVTAGSAGQIEMRNQGTR